MNTIFKSIQDQLAEVPELKYIDENWGQLNLYGTDIPVQFPCALIAMTGGQFTNTGNDRTAKPYNRQEGTLSFEFTIAKQKLSNTSRQAPLLQKTKGFEIWEIVEKVHEAIQGWKPVPAMGKLIRTNLASMQRNDGVQEIKITYTAGIHDC